MTSSVLSELALGRLSSLAALYNQGPALVDYKAICLAAVEGDELARRVVDRAAEYIADCVVILANALDIDLLVLGGMGVSHVAGLYQEKVSQFLRERPLARKTHAVRVAISEIAANGAALGAASTVLHANYAPHTANLVSA